MLLRVLRKLQLLIWRGRFHSELGEEMTFHPEQNQDVEAFRLESMLEDLRFAARQLRKNPGFAVTAILVLAMGMAASVAIFAFVDRALLQPLPYPKPSRLGGARSAT